MVDRATCGPQGSVCPPLLSFGRWSRCLVCFQDNSKWSSGLDEQIMSWATSRPEVSQGDLEPPVRVNPIDGGLSFAGLASGGQMRRAPLGCRPSRAAGRGREEHPGADHGAILLSGPAGADTRPILILIPACPHFLHECPPPLPQVVCGQNCTFVIQPNGTVLACGEGSYGRLGQGNSDDLHVLTVISALQGDSDL